jgi:hypothetical protein
LKSREDTLEWPVNAEGRKIQGKLKTGLRMKRNNVYGKRNRDQYGWLHGVGLGHSFPKRTPHQPMEKSVKLKGNKTLFL